MKMIAFYLPQFHEIPENNAWWGEGFTEWVNVKKAKPLFDGHLQPRVPLNRDYYDLSDVEVMRRQAGLAKEYGVYGFCFYHYWFSGHLLLEKPVEQFLAASDIDRKFCLCWANQAWTNTWADKGNKVLIAQHYGTKDEWKQHFDYLLPFFRDARYIKENNKPLFVIYRAEIIDCLNDMLDYWNQLAVENGFDGIAFAYQDVDFDLNKEKDDSRFDYDIEYQPGYARTLARQKKYRLLRPVKRVICTFLEKHFKIRASEALQPKLLKFDYDKAWQDILAMKPVSPKSIPGAFVNWDNTPRKAERGMVYTGVTPEKFRYYLEQQIRNARKKYRSDKIFLFAWNEWAEGGFLEPDEEWKYGMLEAVRDALTACNELEQE